MSDILKPHYPPPIGRAVTGLREWLLAKANRCHEAADRLFAVALPGRDTEHEVRDMLLRMRDDFRSMAQGMGAES